MQTRADPTQLERVRSARAVSQMGLERQDCGARRRSHKTCAGVMPERLDAVGNRGFSGAVKAARGSGKHAEGLDPDG